MRALALTKEIQGALETVSECAAFEARCLLEHFLELDLNAIYLDKEIGEPDVTRLYDAVKQRQAHIPLQYIIGEWAFMDCVFEVNENVLIPRPETELLCECLADVINKESVVYDLCSGSGCIAVSVAKATGAKVYAIEKYTEAFEVLQRNIKKNGVSTVVPVQADISKKPPADLPAADIIFSNPPYIESGVIPALQREVQCEPIAALDGGEDGLYFYRKIYENYVPLLKPNGLVAVEIGEGQEQAIKEIFTSLTHIKTIEDYNRIARVVIFRKENE